jgi:hypothetical protein
MQLSKRTSSLKRVTGRIFLITVVSDYIEIGRNFLLDFFSQKDSKKKLILSTLIQKVLLLFKNLKKYLIRDTTPLNYELLGEIYKRRLFSASPLQSLPSLFLTASSFRTLEIQT